MRTRKTHAKPEKMLETQVLYWCRSRNWKVHVVDSKAVYSIAAGRFLNSQAPVGFPDIVGMTNEGIFVGIELKAKGRRATLKPHQRMFLLDCIKHNGFAVCVDSVELLSELYHSWANSPSVLFLMDSLPKEKTKPDSFQNNHILQEILSGQKRKESM